MTLGAPRTMGVNAILERMSASRSTPGAISASSIPSLVRANTQRSVTYRTGCPFPIAVLPLNVTCSTCSTNLTIEPSFSIPSLPPSTDTLRSPAVNVPTKTTFLAFWLMLMNPPAPASRGPNLLTFRLPCRSACASPRNATSTPPPS